jgi:hypothetical protein
MVAGGLLPPHRGLPALPPPHAQCWLPGLALFTHLGRVSPPRHRTPPRLHPRARRGARGRFRAQRRKAGGWWEWKTEKRALEMLFTLGELMVVRRQNFHRVYDLRERVLPSWHDGQLLPVEEARRELVLKAVRALGVTTPRWVTDYFRTAKRETLDIVLALARRRSADGRGGGGGKGWRCSIQTTAGSSRKRLWAGLRPS